MKNLATKITSVILAAVILASVALCGFTVSAEQAAEPTESSLMKLDGVQPSGFSTTTNPYGYGVGMPFLLSEQSEIMLFRSYNQQKNEMKNIQYFNGSSNSQFKSYVNKQKAAFPDDDNLKNIITDGGYPMPDLGTWSMVQAVAFDPNNTGRKDHIAFIGFCLEKKAAYSWIVNAKTNTLIDREKLGSMDWVDDTYDYYQANNFFSITAGDFDGDGKDTVIAYAALTMHENSDTDKGCTLFELEYDKDISGDSYYTVNETKNLFNGNYRSREKSTFYDTDKVNTDKSCRNKLVVNLAVGDFDCDGLEDLAVQSFLNRVDVDNVALGLYAQSIKIVFGRKEDKPITQNTRDLDFDLRHTPDGSEETYFPVACSMAAGDIDGDGDCDLVVAGMEGRYKVKDGKVDGKIDAEDDKCRIVTVLSISGRNLQLNYNNSTDVNGWTSGGWFNNADDCWQPYGVETVAINGKGDKEFVFINGKFFDFSAGSPQEVYQLKYFDKTDGDAGNSTITNAFFTSVISGNFDGNEAGREQVVFVIGLKQDNYDDYHFVMGYMGGSKYDDKKNSDGSIKSYGAATEYTGTDITSDDCKYIFEDKGDNPDEGLNCFIVAVDRDNDGVLAKYQGVEYAYTDPEVKAVLQAAPYFSEIQDYGNNETEYVLETIYELTQSSSDNVSYSLGMTMDVDAKVFAMSIEAGYCMDWTKTYEETLTETYSTSFSATAYDTVVVNRIPVFIYVYNIQNSDGTWPETDVEKAKSEMRLTIPQEPVYESLSVDDYNEFAGVYNSIMKESNVEVWNELHVIDEKKHWLYENEGNPYAYNQHGWGFDGANQISKSPFALGTNNALNKVSWSEENTNTVSTETSHGFYFGLGMSGGSEFVKVGFSTNLEYSHGSGEAVTNGTAVGTSCSVTDIDGPGLIASGVPKSVVDSYKFYWTFGQWEDHICGKDGQKTIFVGYGIENIVSPGVAVTDLAASPKDIDKVLLTWSAPDKQGSWPEETGYYVYIVEDGKYRRISERLDKGTNEYTVSGLESNTEYEFVITTLTTVDNIDKESMWSNVASSYTLKSNFKVNIDIQNADAVDFSATHMGNVNIKDGDMILEGNTVNFNAEITDDRYVLLGITLTTKGGKSRTFSPDPDGKFAEGFFVVDDETTITVVAKMRVDSSFVSYDDIYEGGAVIATVNGAGLPAAGGTVTSDIEFIATPKEEYEFIGWQVTSFDDSSENATVEYYNQSPLKFVPTAKNHHITANFVHETEYSIKLSDSYIYTGKEIKPDDIIVTANGNQLGISDYDLTFENNINVGKATVIATFKNAYKGSIQKTFEIKPAELKIDVSVNDKPFDGNNTATIKSAELIGVLDDDFILLQNGTATFEDSNIAKDIPVSFTEFTITGPDAGNYYLVQPTGITAEIYSNYCTVTININNPEAVDFSAKHLGNVEIADGDSVVNGDVITLNASVVDDSYTLIQIKVKYSDDSEKTFFPNESGIINALAAVDGDTEINVEAVKKVDESYVEFSEGENGYVSATVNGFKLSAPGGTVTANVEFTADANEGYALKAWEITNAEGQTITVDAADKNIYTLVLTSSKHTVKAVFVPEEETAVNVTINYFNYGGKILIENANGEAVEYDATNTVSVPLNSVLKFTAQPAYGCSFKNWTDDAANQTETSFTMQITKDTVIGADFNISIQYALTYSIATGNGSISLNPAVASGENLPVNSEIILSAKADDGYFIDKWVITQGGKSETVYSSSVSAADDSISVILSGGTDVKVYFVPETDYRIAFGSEYIYSGKEITPDDITVSANGTAVKASDYDLAFENNIKAGTAKVNITFKNNYSGRAEATFEINPAELDVDVKVNDKQYDGINTATIKSAELNGIKGDDEVILENGIPTFDSVEEGKNIAVSFTDFAISGADASNYILIQPAGVTADIFNKYKAEAGEDYTVNSNEWINEDFVITAGENRELSLTNTADGEWQSKLIRADENGNGKIEFYVRNTVTGAISKAAEESYKIDKTNPQGKVSVADNSWREFLNTVTFEIFFNDTQTVKIEAEDNQSGIASIGYYRSAEKLSQAKIASLPDVDWTDGNSVNITPDECNRFIYYVRIIDVAGNITYISTDGAEFDTTAPVISGITSGEIYYTEQTATAADKHFDSVAVNGEKTTNPAVLKGNVDVVYAVTATDKAGNVTTVTVTMKPISVLAEKIAELTEENVSSDDLETIEEVRAAVNSLDTKTEDEINAVNEILDKCDKLVAATQKASNEINALKAEADSYDVHKINIFQKEELEDLLARTEESLNDANMGKEEKERLEAVKDQTEELLSMVTCLDDYLICPTRIIFTVVDFFKWVFNGIKNLFNLIF